MGIKNYQLNLIELFPDIKLKKMPKNISNLCIDLNMILHQICHLTKNETDFIKILKQKLNQLIKKIRPSHISIFTDGQAILAKAKIQINRRNKYLYSLPKGISPLNLTPGTPFMDNIDDAIIQYLEKLPIKSYYSSSKENNEGEIKLFNWLKSNNNLKYSNICIFGNDSDLIVLALASIPLLDIYLYNNNSIISLYKLVKNLSKITPNNFSFKTHPVRMDFVLLSLFQGNDYNAKIADFRQLLNAYNDLQKNKEGFLVKRNGNINLYVIKKLFSKIEYIGDQNCNSNNVTNYLNYIQLNIDLYIGKPTINYIPSNLSINLKSIVKFIPKHITIDKCIETKWLNTDVYLLLLMPYVGKKLLPERLKHFMDDNSPLNDLFPKPCKECIIWKSKIRDTIKLCQSIPLEDKKKYSSLLGEINLNYNSHLKKDHKLNNLPIKRIEDSVLKNKQF